MCALTNLGGVVRGRPPGSKGNPTRRHQSPVIRERTLTERIAKRIRRGQGWRSGELDGLIVIWARQYSEVYGLLERG